MGKKYVFNEIDKDNKTYIRLLVNGINILSQGSGFLQITEIFSSLEYTEAGMYILLMDEPDSHLHMSLQRNLIKEFRNISNTQMFIITHNNRFLDEILDEEILYIDEKRKESCEIKPLEKGYKNLVIRGLSGSIDRIDELRNAKKIILCEGEGDKNFFEKLLSTIREITGNELPDIYIEKIYGIDTLSNKLLSYSRAYSDIVSLDAEWIIIRDSDCLPISMQGAEKKKSLTYIGAQKKDIIYQNGYGIESTFIAEPDKFSNLLISYYGLTIEAYDELFELIKNTNLEYFNNVINSMHPIHIELESHFKRQKANRTEYKDLHFRDMLSKINKDNIQYIMTKKILNIYLDTLHQEISKKVAVYNEPLNYNTLIDFYLSSIRKIEDLYLNHNNIIERILKS
jgi:predicted ATP-dependent endonuclease of OLD family